MRIQIENIYSTFNRESYMYIVYTCILYIHMYIVYTVLRARILYLFIYGIRSLLWVKFSTLTE